RFGTSLAEAVEDLIRAEATSPLVQTETYTRAGTAFAESRGMTVGIEEHRLLLDLPSYLQADADRYKDSGASSPEAVIRDDPDFSNTKWIGPCDEEDLDSWARLLAQKDEDVPTSDLTRVAKHADAKAIRCHEQRMAEQGWVLVSSMAHVEDLAIGYTQVMVCAHDHDLRVADGQILEQIGRAHL